MPRVNRLFSDLVGSARLWNAASIEQVGDMVGLPVTTVLSIERGELAPPQSLDLVEQWAGIFGLDGDLVLRAAMLAWGKVELPLDLETVASTRNALAMRLVRDWTGLTEGQCLAMLRAIAPPAEGTGETATVANA
jgi:transcriptional regulator with XRE-family HTH domain